MATRPTCARCSRPLTACFCAHLQVLPTRTRVLLLQHPREERMAIGTARMAHLSLPNSVLRVGTDFAADAVVREALAQPQPPWLLFPGAQAVDVSTLPDDRAITLVVVDGTWWQARKLLKLNPALAALPRVSFTPSQPSRYLIRRQPAEFCVSTIEALAQVLETLEPGRPSFAGILAPFHAMVAHQRWFMTTVSSHRHKRAQPRPGRRLTLPARLRAQWPRLVCVQGEANAWPRRDPARQDPETIHWVAQRPATGETFEAIVAPRRELAPATPGHVEVPRERLLAGGSVESWHRSWREFARPDDVLVLWGTFYRNLAIGEGLPLSPDCIDLRGEMNQWLRVRVGTVEECAGRLGVSASPSLAGRGGRRLAGLFAVLRAVCG
ncbi:MAG TPA: tRNA-uridine aminocarboxypropyltransferase [Polyangia bacterium]|nr:tRNA-uridine aminocarboxypropyltransferase [Polyangia bacterium]